MGRHLQHSIVMEAEAVRPLGDCSLTRIDILARVGTSTFLVSEWVRCNYAITLSVAVRTCSLLYEISGGCDVCKRQIQFIFWPKGMVVEIACGFFNAAKHQWRKWPGLNVDKPLHAEVRKLVLIAYALFARPTLYRIEITYIVLVHTCAAIIWC